MNFYNTCLFFTIMFGALELGLCFQCYSCAGTTSGSEPISDRLPPNLKEKTKSCADPIDISGLSNAKEECSDDKSCAKFTIKEGDVQIYVRGCLVQNSCELFDNCSLCTGDLCNSSSTVGPSLLMFTVINVVVAKFYL